MKNLKIYKKALALTTAVGITLFSGCSSNEKNVQKDTMCHHMIVEFGAQPVIFKECEGYDIDVGYTSHATYFEIIKDDKTLIEGKTRDGQEYFSNHEDIDEIEEMAIEKGAYIYKLN